MHEDDDQSTTTIYAGFNGEDKTVGQGTPDYKITAKLPFDHGDLFFDNNCLVDCMGQYSLRCSDEATKTDLVDNPY
ncbi:hypothetical protein N7463_000503 [Penicillium fimorum]|uniref:Uncharacterized protein n=1 Tax=Penicillium fimorum TaxID=1882269 RepID=A0A9W9Y4D2_9EURO|nr:hypothetical protein N7463_000503 [Penicillium fimorum]